MEISLNKNGKKVAEYSTEKNIIKKKQKNN